MNPTSVEGSSNLLRKQACIIHCSDGDSDSNLVSPQHLDSWKTLLRAAEIRQHLPILDLAKDLCEGEIPPVQYHRRCRSIFTLKKSLDSITQKNASASEAAEESSRRPSRDAPSKSVVYDEKCIFCEKSSKYMKGQNSREPLIQCSELRADDRIRKAAATKLDQRMLAITSRELVAAEGHYHRSCYRAYTRGQPAACSKSREESEDAENQYEVAEKKAYEELFSYIRNELFPNPEVLRMTNLSSRLQSSMKSLGVSQIKDSTKKNIRRRMETELGGSIHIFPDENGKLLLYPDSLSMTELAKTVFSLKNELQQTRSVNSDDAVTKAALWMRNDIIKQDTKQVWPPDVEQDGFLIPESITQFLQTLLSGNCNSPSERVKRLVTSFGSDLVFAVTHGRIKPPKHVLLPFAVKSLTGNTELVQTLNRLGHSVSYSQFEEIDTALCLQKLELSRDDLPLPANIYQNVFTTLAYDNIDRLEETCSGAGTSHRVNGIAVQAKIIGPAPQRIMPTVTKSKKRSVSPKTLLLPTYNSGQRVGPPNTASVDADTTAQVQDAKAKNLVWLLARMSSPEAQSVSSWTGFNIQVRNNVTVVQDTVGYLPTINAPATELSTVYEMLNQAIGIMESLQLKTIVCVFDQALYAKAAEIMWKHEKFKNIIIRMGVFHTICILLSILGKRFQDGGLRDLCVESGVIAEGSIAGVMEGRKYNRAVRLHKLVYEALMRLAWKSFLLWLKEKHPTEMSHMEEALRRIDSFQGDICQASLTELLENDSFTLTQQLFQVYLDSLRNQQGLSAFWMSYLDMTDIMLGLIRASREGNWMLHLACIRVMIPWCFAYDKLNYARYLSYYYATMTQLPANHPEVHAHFLQGGFSVQLGSRNPFGRIPVDQTIEETVNKDTQTSGGTKGFSLKTAAVYKYYLTSEYRSAYLRQLREMVGQGDSQFNHPDLQLPRIRRDEAGVQSIVDILDNCWLNPFSPDQCEFVSLSTATVAPPHVVNDLLDAHKIGEQAYQAFKHERLETTPPIKKFYDTITKKKLKTFSDIGKKTRNKGQAKDVVLKADRNLFGHMILVAQSRELHMRDVLAHPLGPVPWTLANADGSLRKTNKAALARELEKSVAPAEVIPKPSTTIIDGMSLVQKMKGNDKTFAQLAESTLAKVLHEGGDSERIDVVFDVYKDMSIKHSERANRGADIGIQFKNIVSGHNIQQWRKLLCSAANKTSLIKFLVEEWKRPEHRDKLQVKTLYVTCEEVCFKITKDQWEEVTQLRSSQEEADTRMLLHALHAAESGYKAAIIIADDTDVLVLSLGFSKDIPCPVYQKCGTQNRTRFLDITKLCQSLGESVAGALIGMHAFTGCDTVSAFAGRGKMGTFKRLKSDRTYQEAFLELGRAWTVSDELFKKLEEITCHMYVPSTQTTDVNLLRYQLFCTRRGEVESSQLPPCQDCLFMHSVRANYQAAIWRRSLQTQPSVPSPKHHGWTTNDEGQLDIQWMRGSPAPDAVLQLLSCKCVRSCKLPECTCLNNGLKCTNLCKLQTCANQCSEEEPPAHLTDSDVDEDTDVD